MDSFAELEINLHRQGDGDYLANFRFKQPESIVDTRFGSASTARIHLDLDQLFVLVNDQDAYASTLSDCFFEDPVVGQVFSQAVAAAREADIPLRVRLMIDSSAADLQSVYWESLRDPRDGSPLFTGENILFSRYLSSANIRSVRLPKKDALSALVFVANPTNLEKYHFDPIDVQGEYSHARQELGSIPAALYQEGPATLQALVGALRAQKPAILYLACHGRMKKGEPYIWLEDEDRCAAVVHGKELVDRIKELRDPPLLVVLVSCQSAGGAGSADARAALGPRIVEAGVPAVLAMQGDISMQTVAEFMPAFFREFAKDGHVEKAASVARGVVRQRRDYWMPVLYTCLITGSLFEAQKPARIGDFLRWGGAGLASLALVGFAWWYFFGVHPMSDFGIAVAEFSVIDENGRPQPSEYGKKISQELYDTLLESLKDLPPSVHYETRGPEKIPAIQGEDALSRNNHARVVAEQWRASILIYGVITQSGDRYRVEPSFFVNDQEFRYGMEITGAERLGSAVMVDASLSPEQLFALNTALNNRAQILENLVKGLSYFYLNQYELAAGHFQQALYLPGWDEEKGKEVGYLLLGASYLRAYDPFDPNQFLVEQAGQAFERSMSINPQYSRAYIGLGSTALTQARLDNPQQQEKLFEARDWLLTALEMPDQPEYAYVPLHAAYDLGVVHLLGVERSIPTFSKEEARTYLRQVLEGYQEAGRPRDLSWYAGNSHLILGRLYGLEKQWDQMLAECALALEELDRLNEASPSIALAKARVHYHIGWAEEALGHTGEARSAYQRAIDMGGRFAREDERKEWQEKLEILGKGARNDDNQHRRIGSAQSPRISVSSSGAALAGGMPRRAAHPGPNHSAVGCSGYALPASGYPDTAC